MGNLNIHSMFSMNHFNSEKKGEMSFSKHLSGAWQQKNPRCLVSASIRKSIKQASMWVHTEAAHQHLLSPCTALAVSRDTVGGLWLPWSTKPKQGIPQLERGGTPGVAFRVFSKRKRELDDNIPEQNYFFPLLKNAQTCSDTQIPWVYPSLGKL